MSEIVVGTPHNVMGGERAGSQKAGKVGQRIDFEHTAELVKRTQKGDNNAFDELYHLYFQHVFYMALKLTGNKLEAVEVTHDSFELAYRSLKDLKEPKAFQNWMSKIVYTTCLDAQKKKNRTGKFLVSDDIENYESSVFEDDEEIIPEAYLQNKETQKIVTDLIDNLPKTQKTSILLHYYGGYSPAEIATITGAKANVIYKRLSDAKNSLKRQIKALAPDESVVLSVGALPVLTKIMSAEAIHSATPQLESAIRENLIHTLGLTLGASVAAANAPVGKTVKSASKASKAVIAASVAVAAVAGGAGLLYRAHQAPQQSPPANSKSSTIPSKATTPVTPTPSKAAAPKEQEEANVDPTPSAAAGTIQQPEAQPEPSAQKAAAPVAAPAVAPVIPPKITIQKSDLIYPVGTVVPLNRILADSGVSAADSTGKRLKIAVARYENINFLESGSYVLVVNAADDKGNPAPSVIIVITVNDL